MNIESTHRIAFIFTYSGKAESWEEIKDDAKNNKIKSVFIGTKEFVNVVHGEWIMLDPINFIEMCSVCRHIDYTAKRHPRYCPHCGARMDLRRGENDEQKID